MKIDIKFPIKEAYSSDYYALIIIDNSDITHYWNFDGDYDGYSHDPCIDKESGTCSN